MKVVTDKTKVKEFEGNAKKKANVGTSEVKQVTKPINKPKKKTKQKVPEEKSENKDEIQKWLKEHHKPGYDALFKQFNETEASVILQILKSVSDFHEKTETPDVSKVKTEPEDGKSKMLTPGSASEPKKRPKAPEKPQSSTVSGGAKKKLTVTPGSTSEPEKKPKAPEKPESSTVPVV